MLKAYMTDQVTLIKKTGTVSWGEKREKETTVKARVDEKNRMVRDFKGEQVVSSSMVTIEYTTLDPQDRIRVGGVERAILSVSTVKAFSKNKFLEVYLG